MDIVVWNENVHESRGDATVLSHYPDGIHQVVADGLRELLGDDARVSTATLQEDQHGLTEERLAATDVLYWWGHVAHGEVSDEVVARVIRHVHAGMGLVVLHSGHFSKVFTRLMGTTCSLKWRNDGERELVWTIAPQHPIAAGIPHPIVIDRRRCTASSSTSRAPTRRCSSPPSRAARSSAGVAYHRGRGRVFYFSPGDQEYPVYHHPDIRRVLANAARWVAPTDGRADLTADEHPRDWFLAR